MTDESADFSEVQDAVEGAEDVSAVSPNLISETVLFTTDWTVETIVNQIDKKNIILNPRWQRRDAWDTRKKTELIESIMLNFPVPPIVLAELPRSRGKYLVLDGKQRLLTIRQFYANDQNDRYSSFKVRNATILPRLNGKAHSDMARDLELSDYLTAFENYPLRTIIVRNWKDENILYTIFLRLNTGSAKLYPQELRQALHPGPFVEFVDDYVENSAATKDIFGHDHPDFRMRDNELIIRYIGFKFDTVEYRGNLKQFLDDVVLYTNNSWDKLGDQINRSLQEMEAAHIFAKSVFGSATYSKWNGQDYERKFNRAIFDILAYAFSNPDVRELLHEKRDEVENAFKILCEQPDFRRSIEVTTKSVPSTAHRFQLWCDALNVLMGREALRRPTIV